MKTSRPLINGLYRGLLAIALVLMTGLSGYAQQAPQWEKIKGDISIFWSNDMGRNGYYDQPVIAELMGNMAEAIGPECVIAPGDIHHFNGVASVSDPLWMTNFETVYKHPELMIDWFPTLGNHEYRGNTQAVLDYAGVSRRWMMPGRYYTKTFEEDGTTLRIVFIDTTPLIDKYRRNAEKYPDAVGQDREAQLNWLDNVLKNATEDWVICVGHHPIFADTSKEEEERLDMQRYVLPILRKYPRVALYGCGHIHNFQHIKMPGDHINYLVNSSASLSRKVNPIEGTVFSSSATGFSIITVTKHELKVYLIDKEGRILHEISKVK